MRIALFCNKRLLCRFSSLVDPNETTPKAKDMSEYEKSKPSLVFPYHSILTHILNYIIRMTSFTELLEHAHPMSDSCIPINP